MTRILIVDDSISVRKALEITFRRHGLDSISAMSGEEALETIQGSSMRVDLLMADVIMPGMNGMELCAALHEQPRFQHLPVILMSGNVDDGVRAKAREAGASGVLRKPFSPDELLPLVESTLKSVRGAGSPAPTPRASVSPAAPELTPEPTSAPVSPPPTPLPGSAVSGLPLSGAAAYTAPTQQTRPAEAAKPTTLATPAVAPPPVTPTPMPPAAALAEPQRALREYLTMDGVELVVLLNASFQTVYQSGGTPELQALLPHLPTYARYFATTARVLGAQALGDPLQTVALQYGSRSVVFQPVGDFVLAAVRRSN